MGVNLHCLMTWFITIELANEQGLYAMEPITLCLAVKHPGYADEGAASIVNEMFI